MLAPKPPDFAGEGGAAVWRCRMDHLDGRRRAHRIGLAFHAQNGGHPLREGLCALASGIELPRSPAQARPRHHYPDGRVTGAAGAYQILRARVLLFAVEMVDFDARSRSARAADARAGGPTLGRVRPITRRAVGDLGAWLPPMLATDRRRLRQSSPSSSPRSSSSSSSGGATMSAT